MITCLRLALWIAALVGAATTPAAAVEAWNCNFKVVSGTEKNYDGVAKIRIVGDTLDWQAEPAVARPIPYPTLQNNDVGTVAVFSQAHMWTPLGKPDHDTESLIGATIIVLDKSTGEIREGAIMASGVYEHLNGQCIRDQDTRPTDLGH